MVGRIGKMDLSENERGYYLNIPIHFLKEGGGVNEQIFFIRLLPLG